MKEKKKINHVRMQNLLLALAAISFRRARRATIQILKRQYTVTLSSKHARAITFDFFFCYLGAPVPLVRHVLALVPILNELLIK